MARVTRAAVIEAEGILPKVAGPGLRAVVPLRRRQFFDDAVEKSAFTAVRTLEALAGNEKVPAEIRLEAAKALLRMLHNETAPVPGRRTRGVEKEEPEPPPEPEPEIEVESERPRAPQMVDLRIDLPGTL